MKKILSWRSAFICLLGASVTFAAWLRFSTARIEAQSTTTTRILLPFITGTDAGYETLLQISNTGNYTIVNFANPTSSTAVTGTSGACTADAYYNGTHYGPGSLGTFAPGTNTMLTEAQVAAATGVPLANSGNRAQLFLTCNFPYAHAQWFLVNPGGILTITPGLVVPPNRSASGGPEQLLQ
jgi:hypothetical protein